jgi:crotonobetainyl-CoA:carnitine CoA-transferase CaiB-like acyl-CoA transferase
MASAALAALHHRHLTGRGQAIDVSLFDSQLAWLVNQGAAFLMDGRVPGRIGNSHPTIVPYETFAASDGHFIVAVGNDGQFRALVTVLGRPDLADDPRFARNRDRVAHRTVLVPLLNELTGAGTRAHWIAALEAVGVPVGPINDFAEAFADPQAIHRGARVSLPHPTSRTGTVDTIGNPIKLGATPVSYRRAPPTLGQHTDEVLSDVLGCGDAEIARLRSAGVIG